MDNTLIYLPAEKVSFLFSSNPKKYSSKKETNLLGVSADCSKINLSAVRISESTSSSGIFRLSGSLLFG
jgi:hypothetical protein